ncbi:MAG TPA: T9SS type A sorting domain-containing protein [Saprospiraceae bacterium]
MTKYFLFVLNIILAFEGTSQVKGDYVWQIGLSSNTIEDKFASSMVIDFNAAGVDLDTFYRSMNMGYFNSSISDDEGKLLLYSNGCRITDGSHVNIPGTLSLSPGDVDLSWCRTNPPYGYPIYESGLFLSFFKDSVILLTHQRQYYKSNPTRIITDSLFYTSVRIENGTYILNEKTVPIVGGDLTDGNVEAVKAKNLEAWWVIQGEKNSNRYFSILLDSASVDTVIAQAIGDTTYRGGAAGQAVFSPDGTVYARYNPKDDLSLFDFDRETGLLSNFRKMHVADSGIIGGLAFSPNSRFLYACGQFDMYQFDTWADDIPESKVFLGHFDNHFDPFPATFYHMQLGPDCRIYIGSPNGNKALHLIHEPDRKGLDCHFEQYAFHLPVHNSITMPNFPNYRLDIAPVCDPGIVAIKDPWNFPQLTDMAVMYPNPTNGPLTIELQDHWDTSDEVHIRVTGRTGNIYKEVIRIPVNQTISLGLEELPAGLYFIDLRSPHYWYTGKVVKE